MSQIFIDLNWDVKVLSYIVVQSISQIYVMLQFFSFSVPLILLHIEPNDVETVLTFVIVIQNCSFLCLTITWMQTYLKGDITPQLYLLIKNALGLSQVDNGLVSSLRRFMRV